MNTINLKTMLLAAIQETLKVAETRQANNQPIHSISPEPIANRFLIEKEQSMAQSTDSNVYWLTAFIETEADLEDAPELSLAIKQIEDGCSFGFRKLKQGQYSFEVHVQHDGSQTEQPDADNLSREQRYLQHKGTKCPNCGGVELRTTAMQFDGNEGYQHVTCLGCMASWEDQYSLSGIDSPQGFDPTEVVTAE